RIWWRPASARPRSATANSRPFLFCNLSDIEKGTPYLQEAPLSSVVASRAWRTLRSVAAPLGRLEEHRPKVKTVYRVRTSPSPAAQAAFLQVRPLGAI